MSGKPRLSATEQQELIVAYQQGQEYEQLILRYGIGRDSINRALMVAGIPIRKKKGGKPQTSPEAELEIVRRYVEVGDTMKIAKDFGICKATIKNICRRHGVPMFPKGARRKHKIYTRKRPRFTERDRRIADAYAEGYDLGIIAKKEDVHEATVLYSLQKQHLFKAEGSDWNGERHLPKARVYKHVPKASNTLREDAFDVLDPEAAYWAGFLMADGNVHKPITRPSHRLTIRLALHDICALERFKEWIGTDCSILTGKVEDDGKFINREFCVLQITSNPICERLMSLGVVPNKTEYAVASPEVASSRDFWRGCVDGDGCVYAVESGRVYLAGTQSLTQQFIDYCHPLVPGHTPAHRFHLSHVGKQGCWVADYTGRERARSIISHLYSEPSWALPRKWALARTYTTGQA
jgi:hypothetical protein